MAYIALARKWRSQSFADLVGQQHIAVTITNAIKANRISQGYLFTGTRGVGKTSAARIFAKALRCQQTQSPGLSCNECKDCLEISEGRSVDVLEIDGASNNGVDAVREIRENAKYLPASGKHKIYIIDEVHMLTTAAFNALLKTLEEPPAHIVFIFATTDPQKIPATVLSRCQRFDFKRVPEKDIQSRLAYICKNESIEVEADALALLSREADGSMRDAISLLEQAIAATDNQHITIKTLTLALGLVDRETVLEAVRAILKQNPIQALEAIGKVHMHGFDFKQFSKEILRYLRLTMLAQLLKQSQASLSAYLEITDTDLKEIEDLVSIRSLEDLDMLFRMLHHGIEDVARSSMPKTVMDVLFIKMSSTQKMVRVSDLQPSPNANITKSRSQQENKTAPISTPESSFQVQPEKKNPPHLIDLNVWKKAIDFVKAQKPLFGSILEHLGFESAKFSSEKNAFLVTLSYTKDHHFYYEQLQQTSYKTPIQQLLKNFLGSAVHLEYKENHSNPKSLIEIEEQEKKNKTELMRKKILESEPMKAAQQLLGARLEKLVLGE